MRNSIENWTQLGYSTEEALQIVWWLRTKRRRLLRQPRNGLGGAAEKLNVARQAHRLVQEEAHKFRGGRHFVLPKPLLAVRYKEVPLLDDLLAGRRKNWKVMTSRPLPLDPPAIELRNFSFLHDPQHTLDLLAEIVRVEGTHRQATIDFLDRECPDIGPYLVFEAMRRHLSPIFTGGKIEQDVQKIIDAVGLRTPLQIGAFSHPTNKDDIWPFHLQQRRPANTSRSQARQLEPQKKEAVADRFLDELDKWLHQVAKSRIGLGGRRLVQKMLGEALDNAERHSQLGSNDGDWSMTGYLVRRMRGGVQEYRIHLAMLSVGSSIAESIESGPAEMVKKMARYRDMHRSRHLTDEMLSTVFALQDGVTKDHQAAAEGRGGTGFQDIFSFFGDLGATPSNSSKAELVIVSGGACVMVAHPYLHGAPAGAALNVERQMWFNAANSPDQPPDLSCVVALPRRLHGTLISMSIPLDKDYLEKQSDVEH